MQVDIPATKLFLVKSAVDRRSKNTSASSISSTAPHLLALRKCFIKFPSTPSGVVPISLVVNAMSGRLVYAAMHSVKVNQIAHKFIQYLFIPAVQVFPVP